MAKITITEKDLTSSGATSVTENIVYIPGYAITGPVNTPTICRSYTEFASIFGSTPYRWKENQVVGGNILAYENDMEKSYLYAAELLKQGVSVMYERLLEVEDNEVDSKKASAIINFNNIKYVGVLPQSNIQNFLLTKTTISETNTVFEQQVTVLNKFPAIRGSIRIVVGTNTIVDTEEELEENNLFIEGTEDPIGTVNYTTGQIDFTLTNQQLETIPSLSFNLVTPIDWTITYSNVNNEMTRNVTDGQNIIPLDEHLVVDSSLSANRDMMTITIKFDDAILQTDVVEASSVLDGINESNFIKIQAKYPGAYGNSINIEFSDYGRDYETGDYLYTLVVNYGNESITSRVSLDYNSSRYIGSLQSSIIDVNLTSNGTNTLNPAFVDLFMFQPVTNVEATENTNAKFVADLYVDIQGDEITIADIYDHLSKTSEDSIYTLLSDKMLYNVKFITSGAYNAINTINQLAIARNMLRCAANRGDSLAVLDASSDIPNNQLLSMINGSNLFSTSSTGEDVRNYGTVFAPEAKFNISITGTEEWMPASFAYFKCLAVSQKNNPNWFAVAGTNRGLVPDLVDVKTKISGSMADVWQRTDEMNINPIMNIKPVGYCIWGNRTLHKNIDGLTASSFNNIRVLSCDIKKILVEALSSLTYEINDNILWNSFRSKVEPYLDQMKTGRGLTDYKLVKQDSTKKATINGLVRIVPIEAVEDFDITFTLEDSLAVVE